MGNELGFWDGVGHGHLRVVHTALHKPLRFSMSRVPRTLLALDIENLSGYRTS